MLRAISEMAAETTVASPGEKPISIARWRPCWRASTMSRSVRIATRLSASIAAAPALLPARQVSESLFQVERRGDTVQRETELDHREGDLRLYPDDDGLRTAELH